MKAIGLTDVVTAKRLHAWFAIALVITSAAAALTASAADSAPSAIERMQQPGPEAAQLMRRTGVWDVVVTIRPRPDAKPVVTTGVIAERVMVGQFLQEVMKPAPGSNMPDFQRIAYLHYNRVEGRWQYVSLDTRFPTGIMPAWSYEKQTDRKLMLQFESIAFPGWAQEVEGRLTRSNLLLTRESDDRDLSQQYFTQADGTGREWLAVQYEYTRRR
jgi:hypothetical protein